MKKILIVHNHYQVAGGEDTVVANEKRLLEEQGHEVILYTRDNSELKEMSFFHKLMLPITTIYNPKTVRDVCRILRGEDSGVDAGAVGAGNRDSAREDNTVGDVGAAGANSTGRKVDIVHVHNTLNLVSPSVYYAARKCGVPVVQTVHNFRLLCPGALFYRDGKVCEDCISKGLGCALKHKCYRGSFVQTLACVLSLSFHRLMGIYGKINYICLTEFNREKLLSIKQIDPARVYVKPNMVLGAGVAVGKEACVGDAETSERGAETGVRDAEASEIVAGNERKNQMIYAGRLDETKGIKFMFRAWEKIVKDACVADANDAACEDDANHAMRAAGVKAVKLSQIPKLIVYGDGELKNWCEEFIAGNSEMESAAGDRFIDGDSEMEAAAGGQLDSGENSAVKLSDYIEMRGFADNEEVLRELSVSKASILPTQLYEGFPMGIVEAFSVGTPVICSDIGNAGSVVRDGVTGYKFIMEDELVECVKKICVGDGVDACAEDGACMGEGVCACDAVVRNGACAEDAIAIGDLYQNARVEFVQKYTPEKNYQMLMEIYDKCY